MFLRERCVCDCAHAKLLRQLIPRRFSNVYTIPCFRSQRYFSLYSAILGTLWRIHF